MTCRPCLPVLDQPPHTPLLRAKPKVARLPKLITLCSGKGGRGAGREAACGVGGAFPGGRSRGTTKQRPAPGRQEKRHQRPIALRKRHPQPLVHVRVLHPARRRPGLRQQQGNLKVVVPKRHGQRSPPIVVRLVQRRHCPCVCLVTVSGRHFVPAVMKGHSETKTFGGGLTLAQGLKKEKTLRQWVQPFFKSKF